jgi:hypothetical protein
MAKYIITERQQAMFEEDEIPMGGDVEQGLLKFSIPNAKIDHPSFSLPAGHTCKYAKDCKSCADRETGAITDNPESKFRCFAASQENYQPNTRKMRWHNYDLLKSQRNVTDMVTLIDKSFRTAFSTKKKGIFKPVSALRLHVGGDFFNHTYFAAWMEMARKYPDMTIYAYTKALPFWQKYKNVMPSNFVLTASEGGTHDYLIDVENFKSSQVVFSPANAEAKGLEIDHDDSHAAFGDKSFATLLHGQQPPKSDASKAKSANKKETGFTGYNDKSKQKGKDMGKIKEGKIYLISEYHYNYLNRILTEEIKPLNPKQKNELAAAGYDANLSVDINGYDFILDLLSDKAKRVFNSIGYRGLTTLTNRDLTQDKVTSLLAGLNVNKVRKPAAPPISGINAKRPVVLPAGGRDLRKRIDMVKHQNRVQKYDLANADVKIDTRTYEDGSSTHIISPLSQAWKEKLGSKKFAVTQDKIRDYLNMFNAEGAKVLAEQVQTDEGWGRNLAAGLAMTAATMGGVNAQAPNQPVAMQQGQADTSNYTATGIGISDDADIAERMAVTDARKKLAQQMGGTVTGAKQVSVNFESAGGGKQRCTVVLSAPKNKSDGQIDNTKLVKYTSAMAKHGYVTKAGESVDVFIKMNKENKPIKSVSAIGQTAGAARMQAMQKAGNPMATFSMYNLGDSTVEAVVFYY